MVTEKGMRKEEANTSQHPSSHLKMDEIKLISKYTLLTIVCGHLRDIQRIYKTTKKKKLTTKEKR